MNDFPILPDDPRLTAYALGELEGDDRNAVEAALRANPALHEVVDSIRATARQLESALATEGIEASAGVGDVVTAGGLNGHPFPGADVPTERSAALPERTPHQPDYGEYATRSRSKLLRFPQVYYVIGGLAAAGFAVMVALHRDEFDLKEKARAESLRVAIEKRGAFKRSPAVSAPTLVSLPPAADVGNDAVDTTAEKAENRAVAVAAAERAPAESSVGNLSLLQQAREAAPAVAGAGSTLTLSSNAAPAGTMPVAGQQPLPRATGEAMAFSDRAAGRDPRIAAARAGDLKDMASSASTVTNQFMVNTAPSPSRRPDANGSSSGSVTLSAFEVASNVDASGVRRARVAPYGSGLDLFPGPRPREPEMPYIPAPVVSHNTESYSHLRDNSFLGVLQNPLSTFSVDVDTASYANVRRFLAGRQLPPPDAVRIEELLNYFPYRYPEPKAGAPFAASLEVTEAPWAPAHRLVRIGLKGSEMAAADRPAANLVFLLDVSGSMNQANKLPLVKETLRLLIEKLRPDDRVAIVTYAGNSGLALASTPVARSREILDALDALRPGGSTNGAMGIQLAYDIAKANFASDGVNRVILCTDGDFNVGTTSPGDLVRLVEEKAKSNVFLTVLGFGMGNLKDGTLEQLADKGNGHYGYIDTRREAEKMLVEQVNATLVTIAKDVKIQVEFNPARVASYRLIGYENRALAKEDFNSDNVDAGEVGAGHTVTALYEIVPMGAEDSGTQASVAGAVEDFRYQPKPIVAKVPSAVANELLTVKVRYKEPTGDVSKKLEFPLTDSGARFEEASTDFRFAAAVAQFGMILRKSEHKGTGTLGDVIAWAAAAARNARDDPGGYRGEFIDLVRKAQDLMKGE